MGNNTNGFLNGFLWGVIIGGSVVFLLGTEKGKKLLKTITEESLEGVEELEGLFEQQGEEEHDDTPSVKEKPKTQETVKPKSQPNGEVKVPPPSAFKQITTTGRRFFKGISKKR